MSKIRSTFFNLYRLANKVGFFHLLSANMLIQITSFGGQIFLTRILSVEDIGTIKVMQSYLNVLVILATFGLNTSVLKLCSENVSEEEKKSMFSFSFFITLFVSLILILGVISLYHLSIINVDYLFTIYIFLIPCLSLTSIVIAYLQSQQKIKTISSVQSLSRIFVVVLSTLFAFWTGITGYINSLVILNFCVFILVFIYIKKEISLKYFFNVTKSKIRKIFNVSIYSFGTNLFIVLLANLNIIIASLLNVNQNTIGLFSIAQLIITVVLLIPSTLGQIMIPKISKVSHDKVQVKKIFRKYSVINKILSIAVPIFIGLIAPFIIPILFGENYSKSVLFLEILLFGYVFRSLYAPIGNTLLSVGCSNIIFYMNLTSVILNILLNYFLILKFGMYGAAIANTITYFISFLIYNYCFKRLYLNGKY